MDRNHNRNHPHPSSDADSDDTSSPSKPPTMSTSHDMLSGLLLEDAILQNAYKKISNPLDKTFFLAVLAGFWVGLGGIAALSIAGGIPVDVRNAWPFLPKLAIGLFFSFGELKQKFHLCRAADVSSPSSHFVVWRRTVYRQCDGHEYWCVI